MAKKEGWTRGVGPYSKTDDIKMTQVPQKSFAEGRKDRTKTVDENSERTDGFAAKLTPPKV